MRSETKIIKEHLRKRFPESKLSFAYCKASNYAWGGDIIRIKTDIPYNQVKDCIYEITKGISIYPKGGCASTYLTQSSNYRIGKLENTMVEFIEIEESSQ